MTRRHTCTLRLLGLLLLAVLQLALPTAGAAAEGHRAADESRGAHVEAPDAECGRIAHLDRCAVCDFVRSAALAAAGPAPPPAAAEARAMAPSPPPARRSVLPSPSPLPRAPPSRA